MASPIKVFNQSFSCLAPLVLEVDLDFTQAETYVADLTDYLSQGYIDYISSVYVDLLDVTAFDLSIYSQDVAQRVYCKRGTITYAPVFVSNWPKLKCEVNAPINSIQKIIVSNIPFFPFTQTA